MENKLTFRKSFEMLAPRSKVWDALTNPELVKQYFFGTELTTDWKKGSPIFYRGVWEGKSYEDKGNILDIEEEKFIRYNYWSSFSGTDDVPANYANISYELFQEKDITVLTIIQDGFKDKEAVDHSERNWSLVMDGLKKLVEANKQKNKPALKEVKPINFLFHRAEVKISDLINQLPIAKELIKECVRLNLHPTGPIHWHYFGFMGNESKPFTLEICLPVGSIPAEYDGKFHFKRSENFKSVSILHEGPWNEIPKSYGILMQYVQEHALQPSGVNRELYINADFVYPEANVTEIQMGLV